MKRVITSLSLLLLLLCGAYAQDISQYEYWTDDDYASRSVVSSSGGSISLDVSTASLSAGIHFLNFRAYRSDGVWGNFYRYLYYIPTLKGSDAGNLRVEYWLDDDLAGVKSETAGSGSLSLSIDISALKPGVHYFNCTPISATGERGNSERYLFYVPLSQDKVSISAIKGYEYWLDDNYAAKAVSHSSGTNATLAISLDGQTSGVHYFNCRAFNERGEYGCPVRKMFYIPQTKVNTNASIAAAEYWLDDNYAGKVTVTGSNTQQTLGIDISHLGSGVHYFNYRAKDNEGVWGNITRQMFYIAQKDAASASGIAEYEYWLDDDVAHKVKGTDSKTEYVFNIDISGLEKGKHTFNFRAKNILETWGDTFSETFEIKEGSTPPPAEITITAQDVQMVYGDAVPELPYNVTGGTLEGKPTVKTTATSTSPVGTYPITIEKGTVTNENLKFVAGTLTIVKAPLKIIANDATRKQGEDNPKFTVSYEGFKNSETSSVLTKQPDVTTTATKDSEPGTYEIKVSGAEAQNYEISYVNGKLTVTKGTFTLTYKVDGEIYKTVSYEYGATITPEAEPTKEGYTFSGWSEIPQTMPAKDVIVTGTFTINKYKLTYMVDGAEYKSYEIEYGANITPEAEPTKEGYTFSGWSEIPETMPAKDVTVTGTFTINKYMVTYIIDGEVYMTEEVEYGAEIIAPNPPVRDGYEFAWSDIPETMPANDITIYGTYTVGIEAILSTDSDVKIFTVSGKPLSKLQKGVNIIRMKDGKTKKIIVK